MNSRSFALDILPASTYLRFVSLKCFVNALYLGLGTLGSLAFCVLSTLFVDCCPWWTRESCRPSPRGSCCSGAAARHCGSNGHCDGGSWASPPLCWLRECACPVCSSWGLDGGIFLLGGEYRCSFRRSCPSTMPISGITFLRIGLSSSC